jgi:hypothetical protein
MIALHQLIFRDFAAYSHVVDTVPQSAALASPMVLRLLKE